MQTMGVCKSDSRNGISQEFRNIIYVTGPVNGKGDQELCLEWVDLMTESYDLFLDFGLTHFIPY